MDRLIFSARRWGRRFRLPTPIAVYTHHGTKLVRNANSGARFSRGKENLQPFWDILAARDHVSQYLKGYRLHLSHGLFLTGRIGHHPWKVRNGSQDSTILFPFQFDADWLNFNHVGLVS
jgi:hypothetical protein